MEDKYNSIRYTILNIHVPALGVVIITSSSRSILLPNTYVVVTVTV